VAVATHLYRRMLLSVATRVIGKHTVDVIVYSVHHDVLRPELDHIVVAKIEEELPISERIVAELRLETAGPLAADPARDSNPNQATERRIWRAAGVKLTARCTLRLRSRRSCNKRRSWAALPARSCCMVLAPLRSSGGTPPHRTAELPRTALCS
jgi:hypothetical protein